MKVVVASMMPELVGPSENAGPQESPRTADANESARRVRLIMVYNIDERVLGEVCCLS